MIIFDLDGTLADNEHRRHFVQKPERCGSAYKDCICKKCEESYSWHPNWQKYEDACDKDMPINAVCELFNCLSVYNDIEIWSGRSEAVRDKTKKWLFENTRYCAQTLQLRPIRDSTPDDELKERWLDQTIRENRTVDFVVDDRKKVVRMWRRRGIFVFDVNQSGKEF